MTPYILGLTGGLASGKSTVSSFFRDAGAEVVDADALVHQLQKAGTPETRAIAEAVGEDVLDEAGNIDRRVLAQKVSADRALLGTLEDILHPAVHREERKKIQAAAEAGKKLVVLDVPLLFEAGSDKHCDSVALCHAPLEARKQRALKRPGMTEEKWQTLLTRRWPDEKALEKADHIIRTDISEEETRQEVEALFNSLLDEKRQAYQQFWLAG